MKIFRNIFKTVLLLLLTMFAFSCNQNLLLQENDDFVPEGYVKISFKEETFERSAVYTADAVTKDDIDRILLTGIFKATAENMVNIPSEKLVLSENFTSYDDFSEYTTVIPEGPWEFTLNVTSRHTGELAWTGTEAATISKTNNTVKIDLEYKTSEKGLLNAKITFPHNVSDSVKYKIVPVDSSSSADLIPAIAEKSADTITLDDSGDFVSISEKLKHGHYIVVLSFYKGETLLNHYNLVVEIKAGAVTTVNHKITDLNQQFSIYFEKNASDAEFVSDFTQTRTYNEYENITLPNVSCFSTIPSGKVFAGWAASETAETGITGWSAGEKTENLILYAVWKEPPSKKLSSIELFEYGQVTSEDPDAPTGDDRKKIGTYNYIQFDSLTTSYSTYVYTTNPYVLQLKEDEQNQEIKVKQGDVELTVLKDDGAELRTLSYVIDPTQNVVILINGENAYSLTFKASEIYYVRGSTQAVLEPAPDYFNLSGSKEYPFNDVQTAVNIIQNTSHKGTIYIDGCVEVEASGKENVVDFNDPSGDIIIEGYSSNTSNGGTIKATANSGQRVLGVWKGKVTLGNQLTITGGNFTGDCGGGIFNDAELTLDGCIITGNSVTETYSMGGALYCNKESKTTIKAGTKITSNKAKYGGGVAVAGGTLIVEGGEISSNTVISGGSGTGIFVKTYIEYNSGNPVSGTEKNSVFQVSGSPVISDFIYLDDDNTDTLTTTLEKITIAGSLSENLKVQLNDYTAGNLVAKLNSGVDPSNYEKLEIYNADGTKSTDVKVGAEGKLEDLNAKSGNISIDELNKTTVSPGNFTRTYISKSDNVNNYLEFNVTDEAYAAISNGYVSSVNCSLYDYKGDPVPNMLEKSCQIEGSAGSYKAKYYPDVSNREIGEYTVVVTAVSGDASVEIESVSIKIWVVY